ncbi:MAG: diguanylate cyclase [Rhizobiales bacterium]|nr:diguanylate cyclase [Hyphomicrobiales bacterium]
MLALAASLPEIRADSPTACRNPFRRLADALPWLDDLSLMNLDGRLVCTSANATTNRGVADRDNFKEVLAKRAFVVSDLLISRLTNRAVVVAAMPKKTGHRVDSVLLASINVDWLSRMATATSGLNTADVLLLDSKGMVIAASTGFSIWIGKDFDAAPEFWNALKKADGVFESAAFDGATRIVGHVRLPGTKAVLTVMRTEADVLSKVNDSARNALAKILVTGLFCFLAIWLGGERLVLKPIDDLTRSAARLGSGDLTARVEAGRLSPELRLLGQTFNGMAAKLAEHNMQLRKSNAQLAELASTDGLTGVANRRRFDEEIEAEWQRAVRDGTPLSVLIADVDHFKKFNDRYGHLEGDECLKQVANVLKGAARRAGDLAGRTGGEEFAVLLPGPEIGDVLRIAETIRARVAALGIPHAENSGGCVTLSIGAATLRPERDESVRKLLDAADAALYRAKRSGRNRVVSDPPPVSLASSA